MSGIPWLVGLPGVLEGGWNFAVGAALAAKAICRSDFSRDTFFIKQSRLKPLPHFHGRG